MVYWCDILCQPSTYPSLKVHLNMGPLLQDCLDQPYLFCGKRVITTRIIVTVISITIIQAMAITITFCVPVVIQFALINA